MARQSLTNPLLPPFGSNLIDNLSTSPPYEAAESSTNGHKLACPFFKRDPTSFRHSRSCTGPGWGTVRRVKEHLYRNHIVIFCQRCCTVFKDDAQLEKHVKDKRCQVSTQPRPEGLTPEQVAQLRRKKREVEKPEERKWVDMYRVVFPGEGPDSIPSPYYDYKPNEGSNSSNLAADQLMANFENFLRDEIAPRVRSQVEREVASLGYPVTPDVAFKVADTAYWALFDAADMVRGNCDRPGSTGSAGSFGNMAMPAGLGPSAAGGSKGPLSLFHGPLFGASDPNGLLPSVTEGPWSPMGEPWPSFPRNYSFDGGTG